jgi:hypothetical protein
MIIKTTTILITLVIFFFQNLLNLLFLFSISFEFVIPFYVVCKPRSRSANKDKARCVGLLTKLCEPWTRGGFIDPRRVLSRPRRSGMPLRHASLQTYLPSSAAMHAVDPSTQGMQPQRHVFAALPCPHQNQIWLFSPQPSLQFQMNPNEKTTPPSPYSLSNSSWQG